MGLVASFEQEAAVVEMKMNMEMGMKMNIAMEMGMKIKMKVWMKMKMQVRMKMGGEDEHGDAERTTMTTTLK